MTSILLRNGYVVTVDPDRRVFPNGYVHVIGERIAAHAENNRGAHGSPGHQTRMPCVVTRPAMRWRGIITRLPR